jgi:hypothetical protein
MNVRVTSTPAGHVRGRVGPLHGSPLGVVDRCRATRVCMPCWAGLNLMVRFFSGLQQTPCAADLFSNLCAAHVQGKSGSYNTIEDILGRELGEAACPEATYPRGARLRLRLHPAYGRQVRMSKGAF